MYNLTKVELLDSINHLLNVAYDDGYCDYLDNMDDEPYNTFIN